MNIFDFNIHLPLHDGTMLNPVIDDDTGLNVESLPLRYRRHRDELKNKLRAANFMLFNQDLFRTGDVRSFFKTVTDDFPLAVFTALVPFRNNNVTEYLDAAIEQGIRGITVHSYIQKITEQDFTSVLKTCEYAQENQLFISIDCSYGTHRMYEHDNLKLAAFIAERIDRVPVILVHSGGIRILEAMLMADLRPNFYLETSFSINYLVGSSRIQDFAFAYRKIGTHRVLYGSDFPYVSIPDALETISSFFEIHRFSQQEIGDMMFHNAMRIAR